MKLILWAVVLGLVPFFVYLGYSESRVESGEVVSYYSLNVVAIAAGIGVVVLAVKLLRREPADDGRRPSWLVPVCAVLVVLGALQVVRGAGVLPSLTGCHSESGTLGFCTPTRID